MCVCRRTTSAVVEELSRPAVGSVSRDDEVPGVALLLTFMMIDVQKVDRECPISSIHWHLTPLWRLCLCTSASLSFFLFLFFKNKTLGDDCRFFWLGLEHKQAGLLFGRYMAARQTDRLLISLQEKHGVCRSGRATAVLYWDRVFMASAA